MSNVTIHTGVWINHDYPAIQGATLTISIRWGNYLIAALSSLVAWAGASAWKVCSFLLHQRYASKQNRDVLDQQLQVLFRGSTSSFDALFETLELQAAWRRRARNVLRRTLPLLTLITVLTLLVLAAGIFVAEVASNTYQDVLVLARPLDCGDLSWIWRPDAATVERAAMIGARDTYLMEKAKFAREYATPHYGNTTSPRSEAPFSQVTLPFHGSPVLCPFDFDGMTRCLGPNMTQGPAWFIDSGLLDSHVHFGVNAPSTDRIQWRKLATCAIVDPTNFTTEPFAVLDDVQGSKINHTYVGIKLTDGDWSPTETDNLTFMFNVNQPYDALPIQVDRNIWQAQDTLNRSVQSPPIKTFNRTDADVSVWIVSQSKQMGYYEPVYDPLFLANESFWFESLALYMYSPTQWFSLLSCYDSFQMCNPNNGECTDIVGAYGLQQFDLGLNPAQTATALRFASMSKPAGELVVSSAIGSSGLTATELGTGLTGHSLPPDQWMREVEMWFATTLVSMQSATLDWVSKPWSKPGHPSDAYMSLDDLSTAYDDRNVSGEFKTMCQNQLIRSASAMQNFSVLATVLVIVLSVSIILTDVLLPRCVHNIRSRRRRHDRLSRVAERRDVARSADSRYQLLRLALESAGIGEWEAGKGDIPVTKEVTCVEPPTLQRGLTRYTTQSTSFRLSDRSLSSFPPASTASEEKDSFKVKEVEMKAA